MTVAAGRRVARAGEALVHAAVAVAATWPLVLHLGDRLPGGSEEAGTVPLFNLWTLGWTADRVPHGMVGWWRAPIFWPERGAFAFSETQPLTGLAFAPLRWATGSPVVAYDLVVLVVLALNGWAAARLARRVGVARGPALLAGVVAQLLPFVAHELGVVQLIVLFPVFLALDALLAWADHGGVAAASGFGLAVAATFLTSTYTALFLGLVLAGAVWTLATPDWWQARRAAEVAVAAGVAAVLVLPFALAQQAWLERFSWAPAEIRANSAGPVDWRSLDPATGLVTFLPGARDGRAVQPVWPGTALVLLAGLGAWAAWRRGRSDGADGATADLATRAARFAVLGVVVAFVVSFGPRLQFGSWAPYGTLQHLPGLGRLRSPFRMAVMAQVLLVPLATLGLAHLWARRRGPALAVAAVALLAVEVGAGAGTLVRVPDRDPAWATWLAGRPAGPVALVPFAADGRVGSFEPTVERMLQLVDPAHPWLNGYSGFFPRHVDELTVVAQAFPGPGAVTALRRAGARWVVVDGAWARAHEGELRGAGELRLRYRGGDARVYALR